MSNTNSGPNTPAHPTTIDADESHLYDLDSDSEDGGMQLDPPDPTTQLQILSQALDYETAQAGADSGHRQDSDTEFTTHPPNPFGRVPNGHNVPLRPDHENPTDEDEEDEDENLPDPDPFRLRMRTRMREEEHAALSILNDWELLTIPQTRRYFQSKLLSPHNPQRAEELYAARFAVPASKAGLVSGLHVGRGGPGAAEIALGANDDAFLVAGAWKEVLSRDEEGWWAPGQVKGGGGKSGKSRTR
ncbi:hypothetical protein N7512_000725 [Penicillium capsulatum]|nr:hypothetical protein N7512_000725 [Penicillium capsulatum]